MQPNEMINDSRHFIRHVRANPFPALDCRRVTEFEPQSLACLQIVKVRQVADWLKLLRLALPRVVSETVSLGDDVV